MGLVIVVTLFPAMAVTVMAAVKRLTLGKKRVAALPATQRIGGRFEREKSKARSAEAGPLEGHLRKLSGHGPLTSALHSTDWLRHLADQEGLEIWLAASPFQADDRVPRLTSNEIALSVGAGYFKLAGLALQSFGNIVGCASKCVVIQPDGIMQKVGR
jgi:hypothetical protein